MIPVFCKSVIVGTYGKKKVNRYVISKEVYSKYAKPLMAKLSKEVDPSRASIINKMLDELFGEYIVEGSPTYDKLTTQKKDEKGVQIKCSLIELPHYFERL
jgi:predicted transcriptional regulator